MTTSARALAFLAVLLLPVGCDKGSTTTTPADASDPASLPEAAAPEAELVPNLEAQPGDTTTCPYSGGPFVVKAEHPKVEYEGKSYWVCSEEAAEKVRADPDAYLEAFEG
jgi:YHS domain-containing protein